MELKYFDHSATTKLDRDVLNEMLPYLVEKYGNASSIYSLGKESKEAINISRMQVAKALGCNVNEIYFTSGGTESDNMILKGIAFANKKYGNHIITSSIEHPAILNSCKFLEKFGFRITYINPDSNGIINPKKIESNIIRSTILISIMTANNEIGTIQPISKIGDIAKKYGIYFHTDSVQAVGNIKLNVKNQNISALSISGHKFYGPKGIGVAYIGENVNFIRFMDGGHQERNLRAGTENVAGIVGIGKAIEMANDNIEEYNKKLLTLRNYYIQEVKNRIPNILINGDLEKRLSGNANICFIGVDGAKLLKELDEAGICASSGSACSAGLFMSSHVLLAIGVPDKIARSSLRITLGKENTIDDVKYLINKLEDIVYKLRNE